MLVIASSGLRPGEANDLNVCDVHPFKDENSRSVRGKGELGDWKIQRVAGGNVRRGSDRDLASIGCGGE